MSDAEQIREYVSKVLIQISRDLRQRSTSAEALLWECLRDRHLHEIKFRRQHPISGTTYVVDFYCHESRLVIELDGPVHDEAEQKLADVSRQREIEAAGNCVLRFRNEQIFGDADAVLTVILTTHLQRVTSTDRANLSASNKTPT